MFQHPPPSPPPMSQDGDEFPELRVPYQAWSNHQGAFYQRCIQSSPTASTNPLVPKLPHNSCLYPTSETV